MPRSVRKLRAVDGKADKLIAGRENGQTPLAYALGIISLTGQVARAPSRPVPNSHVKLSRVSPWAKLGRHAVEDAQGVVQGFWLLQWNDVPAIGDGNLRKVVGG